MAPASFYERLTPEQIARIKLRYEAGAMTIAEIAAAEELEPCQITNLRTRLKWQTRRARMSRAVAQSVEHDKAIAAAQERAAERKPRDAAGRFAPRAAASAEREGLDMDAIVEQATGLVERELAEAKARAEVGEAGARTLASLARSLSTLRSVAAQETGNAKQGVEQTNDEPPLDLAELRRDLARKLAALRDDGENG